MANLLSTWSLLPGDATSEARLVLLTDADAGTLTVEYGTAPQNLAGSVQVTGQQLNDRSEHIYHAKITGLPSDSLIHHAVSGLYQVGEQKPLRTFPETEPEEGLRILVLADTHTREDEGCMFVPEEMDAPGDTMPDIAIFPGDVVKAFLTSVSETAGGFYVDFSENFLPRMSKGDFLVPIVWIPGNHETGNHTWEGVGDVTPQTGYYHIWNPNVVDDVAPAGLNYGAFSVGGYLQILALDTHSAQPYDVGDWMADEIIDSGARHVIPMHHSPLASANVRHEGDMGLQMRCRNAFLRQFIEAENVRVTFSGHVHIRAQSVPFGIVEEEPAGDAYFVLADTDDNPDGYVVAARTGLVEFGQGYRSHRVATPQWFFSRVQSLQKNFNVVTVAPDRLRVEVLDENGQFITARTWFIDAPPAGAGAQANGEWASIPLATASGMATIRRQGAGNWA